MKMILKLIVGMIAGIVLGLYSPDWTVRTLLTISEVIGQLIKFTIPLIILFYITNGIASLPRNSGRLLGRTVGFAYGSTIIAGTLAYFVGIVVLPILSPEVKEVAHESVKLGSFFSIQITPLFGVISALVAAFIFGIGISANHSDSLKKIFSQGCDIIEGLLSKVIIPLLPIYIAGVFADMAAEGSAFSTLQAFGTVLVLVIIMHWAWLSALFIITGIMNGRSPVQLLRTMLPAYFTALGTMSSAATIPVTLRSVKEAKVSNPIANFVVPLCANIHLSGSTITIVTCTSAVMLMSPGVDLPSLGEIITFILMLGVIMIAAPGAPGGAVMSAIGLLTSMLGFNETQVALMIALYLAQDSFGTATNVTGDGVISLWMERFFGKEIAEKS
jgi:Na+/H+-dicarboxylate symporter